MFTKGYWVKSEYNGYGNHYYGVLWQNDEISVCVQCTSKHSSPNHLDLQNSPFKYAKEGHILDSLYVVPHYLDGGLQKERISNQDKQNIVAFLKQHKCSIGYSQVESGDRFVRIVDAEICDILFKLAVS